MRGEGEGFACSMDHDVWNGDVVDLTPADTETEGTGATCQYTICDGDVFAGDLAVF